MSYKLWNGRGLVALTQGCLFVSLYFYPLFPPLKVLFSYMPESIKMKILQKCG